MRTSFVLCFAAGIAIVSACAESVPPPKYDLLTWPRMSVSDFGCFLEKEFGFKDVKFNCSLKNYEPVTSPCEEGYHDGPDFPNEFAPKIHPLLYRIEITWEAGTMQAVSFSFRRKIEGNTFRNAFGISSTSHLPENVVRADIADDSGTEYLALLGFEHWAAGDADCEDDDD